MVIGSQAYYGEVKRCVVLEIVVVVIQRVSGCMYLIVVLSVATDARITVLLR